MAIALAGYYAEDLIYNETSTLSKGDLRVAQKMSEDAIKNYGFGHIDLVGEDGNYTTKERSQRRLENIESWVDVTLSEAQTLSNTILHENKDILIKLRDLLLKKKTLYVEDFDIMFSKEV